MLNLPKSIYEKCDKIVKGCKARGTSVSQVHREPESQECVRQNLVMSFSWTIKKLSSVPRNTSFF